jgi:hypothetical protein
MVVRKDTHQDTSWIVRHGSNHGSKHGTPWQYISATTSQLGPVLLQKMRIVINVYTQIAIIAHRLDRRSRDEKNEIYIVVASQLSITLKSAQWCNAWYRKYGRDMAPFARTDWKRWWGSHVQWCFTPYKSQVATLYSSSLYTIYCVSWRFDREGGENGFESPCSKNSHQSSKDVLERHEICVVTPENSDSQSHPCMPQRLQIPGVQMSNRRPQWEGTAGVALLKY